MMEDKNQKRNPEHRPRAICYRCGKSVCTKHYYDHGSPGAEGLGHRTLYFSHNDKAGNFCPGSDMHVR